MKMDVRFRHVFFAGSIGALCALIGVAFGIGHIASAQAAQAVIAAKAQPAQDAKNFYPLGECFQNLMLAAREVRTVVCTFTAPVNAGADDFVMARVASGPELHSRAWLGGAAPYSVEWPTSTIIVYFFVENLANRPVIAKPSAAAVLFHVPYTGEKVTPTVAPAGGDGQ